ncbi:hypothetical protein GDO86_003964 [Hymenochirus boettgeri]|uniref:Uncharacterized protein n=1 Tax=Hymenochirus boettgeri TaxID=247094 RepID=A0A8T2K624_9PIPI|nr:hypothetical protein GDO86_003964 [Hymenochirus boettgeri]
MDKRCASDADKDFLFSLNKNEKTFQTRMRQILIKYNKPFENDILVDLKSLTCITPNEGFAQRKHEKKRKTKAKINVCNKTFLCEEDSSCPSDGESETQVEKNYYPLNQLSEMKHGKTYSASVDIILQTNEDLIPKEYAIQRTQEESFSYQVSPIKHASKSCDHSGSIEDISLRYLEDTVIAGCSASPIKASISTRLKQFIGRHNKIDHQTAKQKLNGMTCRKDQDKQDFSDNYDSSDQLDVSLADVYPNMIVCISRLMEIPCKRRAAANIVKYYRRRVWFVNKNKLNLQRLKRKTCKSSYVKYLPSSSPVEEKTCTTFLNEENNSIFLPNKGPEESGFLEYNDSNSRHPLHTVHHHQTAIPYSEQISLLSKTLTLSEKNTFPCREIKPNYLIYKDNLSPKYGFPFSTSVEHCHSIKVPSNRLTLLKNDAYRTEIQNSTNKLLHKESQHTITSLVRLHSCSVLPNSNRNKIDCAFEALYKNAVLRNSPQRSLRLNNQYPLSDTLNALINSPILNKGKRPASEDLPFSRFKRHKSASDTIVPDLQPLQVHAVPSQSGIHGSGLFHGSNYQRFYPKKLFCAAPNLQFTRSLNSPGNLTVENFYEQKHSPGIFYFSSPLRNSSDVK